MLSGRDLLVKKEHGQHRLLRLAQYYSMNISSMSQFSAVTVPLAVARKEAETFYRVLLLVKRKCHPRQLLFQSHRGDRNRDVRPCSPPEQTNCPWKGYEQDS